MKYLLCLFLLASSTDVFAAAVNQLLKNTNAKFISPKTISKIHMPSLVSGGGTKPFTKAKQQIKI